VTGTEGGAPASIDDPDPTVGPGDRGLMRALRDGVRRLVGIDPQAGVTSLPRLAWVGSRTHGYCVPEGLLGPASVCYAVGAGQDITFDTELAHQYGCRVRVIDPTPEGHDHFRLVHQRISAGEPISATNGEPFRYRISPERLGLLNYVKIGVWDRAGTIRFWEPTRDNYVSHSIAMFQESGRSIELPVDRLGAIMAAQGDASIDLLKLEIEGAEYRVLETVVQDRLDVKAIAVEYDEVYHVKGRSRAHLFRIRASTRRLLDAGYRLVHSTPMFKRTFVREDVFATLAASA
jgi:FkbM family methyltransferase